MTSLWLIGTHLGAFLAGGVSARLVMVRYVRVREIEGHRALELAHREREPDMGTTTRETWRHSKVAVIVLLASLFVIAVGVQAKLAADDNARRDAHDAAYADCLTAFAGDLVESIRENRAANIRLEQAERRKDRALDRLIVISLTAQSSGATTQDELDPRLVARYEAVLRERVAAQKAYQRVYRDALEVRRQNGYVKPQVVCNR